MPSKKTKRKSRTSKSKTSGSKKKQTAQRKRVAKSKTAKKSLARKAPQKKARASGSRKKKTYVSTERELNQEIRSKNLSRTGLLASRQSGDLQGLSRAEQADSESVDELVEEGNLFEAGAVAGVEEADNADEREVRTREIPEDDVPEEYLDEK